MLFRGLFDDAFDMSFQVLMAASMKIFRRVVSYKFTEVSEVLTILFVVLMMEAVHLKRRSVFYDTAWYNTTIIFFTRSLVCVVSNDRMNCNSFILNGLVVV